jgi:hypothetical protein
MSVSSVKRCASAFRPCSPNLWSHRFRIHHLRIEPQPQIGLASLCRRTTAARAPAASRTAARTAAEPTAAATEPTAAATEPTAAETTRTVQIRRDRRRWLPVRSLAVTLDRARQSIAVHRNSPIANIARPRVDDVGSGVHCLSIALP